MILKRRGTQLLGRLYTKSESIYNFLNTIIHLGKEMEDNKSAIALAANQIDHDQIVFAVRYSIRDLNKLGFMDAETEKNLSEIKENISYYVGYNEYEGIGDKLETKESCMSDPERVYTVCRYAVVKFADEIFTGLAAQIIQHEVDHLNGICIWGRERDE